jgi:ferredoxin
MAIKVTIRVDKHRCRGSGLCVAMAPQLFELGTAPYAVPRHAGLDDPSLIETARTIAECCPTEAIVLRREENPVSVRTPAGHAQDTA